MKFGLAQVWIGAGRPAILRALWRIPAHFTMDPPPIRPWNSTGGPRAKLAKGRSWGSFELLEVVGRGTFVRFFRAWDPRLQREIGLKILLPRSVGGEAQFENCLREARALASVDIRTLSLSMCGPA